MAKYFVLVLGIGIAISILGAPIQPVLAAAIIVAVVIVLALRGVADNFAAGVVLQSRKPIRVGDFVASLRALVEVDKAWVPPAGTGETSLYLRPFMYASEAFLGVRPANEVTY